MRFLNNIIALVACLFMAAHTALATPSSLELEITLDRTHHLQDTSQGIYTLATITAPPATTPTTDKPQLNLCLVIDRSGSMAGPRIEEAKSAITQTINALAQNDIFSLITYGSEVETVIPAQNVATLQNIAPRIQSIEAIGGSALYDALNQAAAQLRRHRSPNSINRMLILSDGEATKGPRETKDFEALAQLFVSESISISTIGLGDSFPEDLLSTLATKGNGNFYFVQKVDQLSSTFLADITPLNTVVARDIELTLEFNRNIDIEESLGKDAEITARTATYKWSQIYADTEFKALLSATLHPSIHSHRSAKILTATLSYLPAHNHFSERQTQTLETKTLLTTSQDLSLKTRIPKTLRVAYAYEIANSIREAIDLADQGKLNKGLKEIKSTLSQLKWINYTLEDEIVSSQIDTLQKTYDRIKADGLNQIDRKTLTARIANQEFTPENPTPESNQ